MLSKPRIFFLAKLTPEAPFGTAQGEDSGTGCCDTAGVFIIDYPIPIVLYHLQLSYPVLLV